ncbi:MAG: geranylgeranylglyceryl/heptaprenylglyceryl phosphate synthase [Dethiobacteria bacterium]|nr:geranylgeranylglyceryl/heptaprenylglyceryl phosphate synthase [Bacillota bacterium]MDW7729466.1 geranylgeranylglyceryl/heptaprenylglyceryl phosphate synthase [Bacillota bacterium]
MEVKKYIDSKLNKGAVHVTLIDPSRQTPEAAGRLAETAQEVGSDLIFVGGSSGITQRTLSETAEAVKERATIPVLFFPTGTDSICLNLDAFLFLSLLNSRNSQFVSGTQSRVSSLLKRLDVEVLSIGYVLIEPGMKLGEIGEADLVARDNFWQAIGFALTAEFMGMSYVYLEAGNGAAQPVPAGMIRAVKREIDIPLIVGGGIRTAIDARRVRQAGADIVVTGTVIETAGYRERLRSILSALKD